MRLLLLLTFLFSGVVMAVEENLWGPINMKNWKKIPCIVGRAAIEKDVKEGKAVFYTSDSGTSKPIDLKLPRCAIWNDEEAKQKVPVICIQAEEANQTKMVGIRLIKGG